MSDRWPINPSAVALDLVEGDELVQAESLIATDPAFAAAVDEQRSLSGLLEAMPAQMRRPPAPPAFMAPAPARSRRVFAWPSFRVLAPAAGAMAVAAVAIVIAFGGDDAKTPQPVQQEASATLVLTPLKGGSATAKLTVTGDRAEIVGSELPPTPEGKHYEAWLAREDGAMKPMGGFTVGEDGTVKAGMEFHEDLSQWEYVDVSIEPDGAPPKHSGTSVLRAQL